MRLSDPSHRKYEVLIKCYFFTTIHQKRSTIESRSSELYLANQYRNLKHISCRQFDFTVPSLSHWNAASAARRPRVTATAATTVEVFEQYSRLTDEGVIVTQLPLHKREIVRGNQRRLFRSPAVFRVSSSSPVQ
jgi:hypothetical protein